MFFNFFIALYTRTLIKRFNCIQGRDLVGQSTRLISVKSAVRVRPSLFFKMSTKKMSTKKISTKKMSTKKISTKKMSTKKMSTKKMLIEKC